MLVLMFAGWLNRHDHDVIEYLKEENKILGEKIGTKSTLDIDEHRIDSPNRGFVSVCE